MAEPPIVETILYIDPERITDQKTHDTLWAGLAKRLRAAGEGRQPRAELQYEVTMAKEYYHSLPRLLAGIELDLHAPIQGRDIASIDEAHRRFSLKEYEQVILLAGALQARAVIIHLTPHNIPWQDGFAQEMRMEQLAIALDSFREVVRYRDRHAPNVLLAVEGLEYPKWWADTVEAVSVLSSLKQIDSAVTSCVDVAHLWHNRYLHPATITVEDFAGELALHLNTLVALAPVAKIHIAGAYIWRRDDGETLHATHAVPGLAPWDRLGKDTSLFLDRPPTGFKGEWMVVEPVLEEIARFGQRQGKLPPIATEVHVDEMGQKMQINTLIRTILIQKG